MLADRVNLTFLESLTLSGIGMFVVFMELIILALFILLLSKVISGFVKNRSAAVEAAPAPAAPVASAAAPAVCTPSAPPSVTLIGVDEPTAAVIMALISHNTDIPLEKLSFKTIKKIEEGTKK